MDPKNILLIQTAFMGDVILTTPMIAAIKKNFPQARLTVLVNPGAAILLAGNPAIHEVLVIDKKKKHRGLRGMQRILGEIRSRNFDVLLSPHESHRTGILAMFSKIPVRYGYDSAGFRRLAYTHHLKRPMEEPEIRRLLRFLEDSLKTDGRVLSEQLLLYETAESRREASELLSGLFNPVSPILLAPSSVWATKRWTPWGFAELAGLLVERFKAPVLLVGSKDDCPVAELTLRFVQETLPPWIVEKVINVCGQTSLPGLYSLMKRGRLLVSNDSAPVHIGCAAQIPVVAIMGATVPSLGYAPIAPRTAVAELEGLPCRPCGTHGANRCPLGHFRCMKELTAEAVFARALKVMR